MAGDFEFYRSRSRDSTELVEVKRRLEGLRSAIPVERKQFVSVSFADQIREGLCRLKFRANAAAGFGPRMNLPAGR